MFKFVGADIVREDCEKFAISYIPTEENKNANGFVHHPRARHISSLGRLR